MKNIFSKPVLMLLSIVIPIQALASHTGGEIQGVIRDINNNQTLPGVSISYFINGHLNGAYSDAEGLYKIKPLEPGNYAITFSFTGYQKIIKREIRVTSGEITFLDIYLNSDNTLPPIEISDYQEPLIRNDYAGGTIKILPEDIKVSVARDVKEMVAQTATVYQKKEEGSLNIRGSRDDATQYIVDGVKIIGSFRIPKSAIQEITVISGGVPAQFGDATGGIVVIVTKSAFNH